MLLGDIVKGAGCSMHVNVSETDVDNIAKMYLNEAASCSSYESNGKREDKEEKETALAIRIEYGDPVALDELIVGNLGLVINVAKKYSEYGVPFLDLVQEGNIGLMDAATKWDYRKGYTFGAYATMHIKRKIHFALIEQGRKIKVPSSIATELGELRLAIQDLNNTLGREPVLKEIADAMGIVEPHLWELLSYSNEPISLDTSVTDENGEGNVIDYTEILKDESDTPLDVVISEEMKATINGILDVLSEREADVLRLRYGFTGEPMTLEQIGSKYSLSRERIRQIEQKALSKVKDKAITLGINIYLR